MIHIYLENLTRIGGIEEPTLEYAYRVIDYLGMDLFGDHDMELCLTETGISYCSGDIHKTVVYVVVDDAFGRNLAHEFVHVMQLVTGQYEDFESDLPYMQQPFEIEAYAMEDDIFEQCRLDGQVA